MPLKALDSKVCRMMLTSRMVLSDEQQRHVCEGDLASYMIACPDWLKAKDDSSKNWMDLDNKMTETVALVRAVAHKYFLLPEDPAMFARAEEVEKLCFNIMNTMVYLINKICYAPNSPEGTNDFDPEYARTRFLVKYNQFAPKLEELLEGPFIMGDTLPIHADYLLYACLVDIKNFVPNAIGPDKHPKIHDFMEKFWSYRSPIRRWFKSNESKTGEYIRPCVPHITELLPETHMADMH